MSAALIGIFALAVAYSERCDRVVCGAFTMIGGIFVGVSLALVFLK